MDVPLHKYMSIIQRYWYFSKVSFKRVITNWGARWPSGLERWLVQATGLSWPGSNPTAENFASELWQFRLPRFASVFRRRH